MTWLYVGITLFVVCVIIGAGIGIYFTKDAFDGVEAFMAIGAGIMAGGIVGAIWAAFPTTWAQTHYNERTITCTVTDKDRGGNDDGMRIYTTCGTFQNTDSVLRGKNTSADLWARIHVGQTQQFRVVGWRCGFTSDFPNVLDVQ